MKRSNPARNTKPRSRRGVHFQRETRKSLPALWTIVPFGLVFFLANVGVVWKRIGNQRVDATPPLRSYGTAIGYVPSQVDNAVFPVNFSESTDDEATDDEEDNVSDGSEDDTSVDNDNEAVASRQSDSSNEKPDRDELNESKSNFGREADDSDLRKSREPILRILREAGFDDIDEETIETLPTWDEVTKLYGDRPRIYGLDQCQQFRNHSDEGDHFVGTAGAFNSGTNLMSEYLIQNCEMRKHMKKYGKENKGVRWQVPWGKHTPVDDEAFRQRHKAKKGDKQIEADNVLPAVTIRDPYVWMRSMCRHTYEAYWPHVEDDENGHCPNLIPNHVDVKEFPFLEGWESIIVQVRYALFGRWHNSLAHFWNDWYRPYYQAPYPKVIVRYEDLIFHAKEVTESVCHCAGGEMKGKFEYIVESAKKGSGGHGRKDQRTSMIQAMIRYGKETNRTIGFTQDDLAFAIETLDSELTEFFGYSNPPLSSDGTSGDATDDESEEEQEEES